MPNDVIRSFQSYAELKWLLARHLTDSVSGIRCKQQMMMVSRADPRKKGDLV